MIAIVKRAYKRHPDRVMFMLYYNAWGPESMSTVWCTTCYRTHWLSGLSPSCYTCSYLSHIKYMAQAVKGGYLSKRFLGGPRVRARISMSRETRVPFEKILPPTLAVTEAYCCNLVLVKRCSKGAVSFGSTLHRSCTLQVKNSCPSWVIDWVP